MSRLLILVAGSLLGTACVGVVLMVVLLAPIRAGIGQLPGMGAGLALSGAGSPSNGADIAAAAQLLSEHVYGIWSNEYDTATDPFMRSVSQFWIESCGSNGVICSVAASGNLQCVEFITAAIFLSGRTLPYVSDAFLFWSGYAHQPQWDRLSVTQSYPHLGDMVIWQGGTYGHITIVIKVTFPFKGHDGSVTVAQGNSIGNRWDAAHQSQSANWYTMPLHPDGTVQTWSGYTVLGYIRQHHG